jgi:hypothetical protein
MVLGVVIPSAPITPIEGTMKLGADEECVVFCDLERLPDNIVGAGA